jgi:hypothetical protein
MSEPRSKKVLKKPATKAVVSKIALKKKPVKKTVISRSTKLTPKAPKKAIKMVRATLKKVVKKPISGKSAAKKAVSKPKIATKKTIEKKVTEVILPTRMSIRAREKALVLATEFEKKIHKPAYALTMTMGALFILFGSYSGFHQSSAAIVCLDASCTGQTSSFESVFDTYSAPEIELITDIPSQIDNTAEILIDTTNAVSVDAELLFSGPTGADDTMKITVTSAFNGRYRIVIPGTNLDSNQYILRVQASDIRGKSYNYVTLGSFSVPSKTVTSSQFNSNSTGFESTLNPDSAFANTEPTLDTTSTFANTEPTLDTSSVFTPTIDVNPEEVDDTPETITETADPEAAEPAVDEIVVTAESILSGRAPLTIKSSKTQLLSVYIRRVQSIQEQLVGKIVGGDVIYYLSTRNFPNGFYELLVRSPSTDDEESNSITVQIQNKIIPIVPNEPETTPIVDEKREVFKITPKTIGSSAQEAATNTTLRETRSTQTSSDTTPLEMELEPKVLDFNTRGSDVVIDKPIKQRTLDRLTADADILDQLFVRYAAAVQSGDPDMIREAKSFISTYQRAIVDSALSSTEDRLIADDLSRSLELEISQIVTKVETFESLRRERSEGDVGKDTDGDGITDIDERVLFQTDPLKADTDGDGFTDGAEIIKGFNPLDEASEAVITYKSPKETVGIVANDTLQVVEVIPDIVLPETGETSVSVQARVKGKALPNSFVTLYIFSTPTIVTVRTEADGSFEYTFSKELEDGEHQVFVALTDNTGDIVAQSAPFTFIKQAEAFTAVDAEAVVSDTQSTGLSSTGVSSFQTVLSMSVLALGILLIMLGVGLRSNRPELIKLEPTT